MNIRHPIFTEIPLLLMEHNHVQVRQQARDIWHHYLLTTTAASMKVLIGRISAIQRVLQQPITVNP